MAKKLPDEEGVTAPGSSSRQCGQTDRIQSGVISPTAPNKKEVKRCQCAWARWLQARRNEKRTGRLRQVRFSIERKY